MNRENHHYAPLSAQGRQRRTQMLGELQRAMHRHHAHKQRRRTIASTGALTLIITLSAMAWLSIAQRNTPSRLQMTQQSQTTKQTNDGETSGAQVRTVSTTPGIADKYISTPSSQHITIIESDEELLRTLAEFGRPSGLIRINGEVRLTNPQLVRRDKSDPSSQRQRDPSL